MHWPLSDELQWARVGSWEIEPSAQRRPMSGLKRLFATGGNKDHPTNLGAISCDIDQKANTDGQIIHRPQLHIFLNSHFSIRSGIRQSLDRSDNSFMLIKAAV